MNWEYYEWNFATKTVIQWERSGECCRCMACCRAEIKYTFGGIGVGEWAQLGKTVADNIGVWLEVRSGNLRLFMGQIRIDYKHENGGCPLVGKAGCRAHKQKARKAPLCEVWPIHPCQTEVFPRCSYRFEKIGEESFE